MSFAGVSRNNDPQWKTSGGEPPEGELQADFINPRSGEDVSPNDGYGAIIRSYTIASGQNIDIGDLVRLDGSGTSTDDITELTAITQSVLGVAIENVVSGAAGGIITSKVMVERASRAFEEDETPTGLVSKTRFATTDVNSVTPVAATHVGTKVALDLTAGAWTIDISDTSNTDVEIVGVDLTRGTFIVEFLDAVIQTPTFS